MYLPDIDKHIIPLLALFTNLVCKSIISLFSFWFSPSSFMIACLLFIRLSTSYSLNLVPSTESTESLLASL